MLTVQYRMNAAIMEWSSRELYGARVTAHASVAQHTLQGLQVGALDLGFRVYGLSNMYLPSPNLYPLPLASAAVPQKKSTINPKCYTLSPNQRNTLLLMLSAALERRLNGRN